MSYRPSDYSRDVRSNTPMSMVSRPLTPGTPGTFDSAKFGSPYQSQDYLTMYDDPRASVASPRLNKYDDPRNMASPQIGGTVYAFKEGGGRATAASTSHHAKRPSSGRRSAAVASADAAYTAPNKKSWAKRHPCILFLIILIIVVVIAVGAAVGGVLASKGNSNSDASTSKNSDGSGSTSTSSSGSNKGGPSTTTASAPAATISPLAKWVQTDPNSKIVGVSLGNWMILERWIDEDWITGQAGDNVWDEWTFTKILGQDKATAALQQHWDTWVVESDIDTLHAAGINAVRIPLGYWAFVPTISNEPYVAQAGQLDRVQRVLGWLHDRGMYAMIDLHGMPGSQNGDQAAGHNTSYIGWFDSPNFEYSYTVLNETIKWIQGSNYSSVVQWICPVNEPRANGNNGKRQQLLQYYESAYQTIKNAGFIMMFHHGFEANPMNYWQDFATGKDPNYLVFNNNPYLGWFPPQSDAGNIISGVCQTAQQTVGYPVPVVMTEYSVINGVSGTSFDTEYYNSQISAWAWSGGAFFWTFKTKHSTSQVLAIADSNMDEYSLTTLIDNGVVAKSSGSGTALSQIAALPNAKCGNIPTPTWRNPSRGAGQYN